MMQTAIHQPMAMTILADTAPSVTNNSASAPSPANGAHPPLATAVSANSAVAAAPPSVPADPPRTVVVVYRSGQDSIVHLVAEVLGKPWTTETSLSTLVTNDFVFWAWDSTYWGFKTVRVATLLRKIYVYI